MRKILKFGLKWFSVCCIQTGAPLHFIDPIAKAYGATLSDDSDGGYLRPCSGDNLPNLEFTFGEAKIVMEPADLFVNLGVCNCNKIQ